MTKNDMDGRDLHSKRVQHAQEVAEYFILDCNYNDVMCQLQ